MKIRINEQNRERIEKSLKEEQAGARARRVSFDDIVGEAEWNEKKLDKLGVAKAARAGCASRILESVANSYGYPAYSTRVDIERGATGWFVVGIERVRAPGHSSARGTAMDLSPAAARSAMHELVRRENLRIVEPEPAAPTMSH